MGKYIDYLKSKIEFLPWVPIVFSSAINKKRVNEVLENASEIKKERFKRVKT
jgi:GTPase